MKILALGGSGAMGHLALNTLAQVSTPDQIVVADRNRAAAEAVAKELKAAGVNASALELDVTDDARLREVLAGFNVVMNSVGPFFRFGVPILKAAIATGTRYYDICDDPEPTLEMLELDAEARAAGVTAIVGAGASPGFMNMLGVLATQGLTDIEDVTSAWSFNSSYQDWDLLRSFKGQSQAALEHFFEQITGTVTVLDGGEYALTPALVPYPIDIPGLGKGSGYIVGHPEPITFRGSFGLKGDCRSLCLVTPERAAEFSIYKARIESGELTVGQAVDLLVARDATVRARASRDAAQYPGVEDLPIYFVAATGLSDGQRVTQFAATRNKPEPMAIGTGVPFAVTVATTMGRDLPAGVFPPERILETEPFFSLVAEHWNVPRAELLYEGSTVLA